VYDKTAKEVIPSLLDGFNAAVFAYGQTSAGKTFTMLGDRVRGEGVMVRALKVN
jgi:precorrin-2 methylase